jgi:hypothetical protein
MIVLFVCDIEKCVIGKLVHELTLLTDGRVLYSEVNGIAFSLTLCVDSTAGIPSPLQALHSLEYKGLIADYNSGRRVGVDLLALEPPPNLRNPRRGPYVALEVDIIALLDV